MNNNPFDLSDEQISKIANYCLGATVTNWVDYVKKILSLAASMEEDNQPNIIAFDGRWRWDVIPEGFDYLTADSDGDVCVFREEPRPCLISGNWTSDGDCIKIGYSLAIANGEFDWSKTLRKRPRK